MFVLANAARKKRGEKKSTNRRLFVETAILRWLHARRVFPSSFISEV